VKGAGKLPVIEDGRTRQKRAEEEEHRRLLYVALTRPRDRLYVAGFEGKRMRPADSWYELIAAGLADVVRPVIAADGEPVMRIASDQIAPHERPRGSGAEIVVPQALPAWALRPAPRESSLIMPMAPSRFAPLDSDEAGEPLAEAAPAVSRSSGAADLGAPSPLTLIEGNRFLRGTLTHALLEHLPDLPAATWDAAATAFLAARGAGLSARTRQSIAAETLAVLRDAAFAAVFGPDSRAEVPIVGEIDNPRRGGPKLRINGQIDRLVRTAHEIAIIDYKTNRPPPTDLAGVPAAYLYQMASYRAVLSRIYPNLRVRAAFLWTDGARLMPIPDQLLDEHAASLWQVAAGRAGQAP
jgi:ATP-dependent helicase/nuclease subunit A